MMKSYNRLSIFAVAFYIIIGLALVSLGAVASFRKNAASRLEHMRYTKILEMEEGLLPEPSG